MEQIEKLNFLGEYKNGTFIHMEWVSHPKLLKEKTENADKVVEKKSNGVVRVGIDYSHLGVNDGKETGSLPWGQWVSGYENILIVHNGKYYLRVYTTDVPVKVSYLLNGVETTKQALIDGKILGDAPHKEIECFNIPVDSIIEIG